MRCLIDTTVRNAHIYYETYRWEPSPAGDISIGAKEILATRAIDLKTVLAEMKKLGGKGEMLVVTHSDKDGLMMNLIHGGEVASGFSVMTKILEISTAIRERRAIAALPLAQRPKAWQGWFKKYDPGIKLEDNFQQGNKDWEKQVELWYEEWYTRQGAEILKLPGGRNDLTELIRLVDDVRSAGFARLEFRACDIGTDMTGLKSAAQFFKVKKLIAPNGVLTFYGNNAVIHILKAEEFEAKKKASPDARVFKNTSLLLVVSPHTFEAYAPAKGEGKAFIKNYIRSSYAGGEAPFVIGGLEPSGTTVIPGKKQVFPLEEDYKKFLVTATP